MDSPESPAPKKRGKKTDLPDANAPKKPRRRKQPDPAADADKPIDPVVWIFLGVLLIVVAAFFYLDSASASGADTRNGGQAIQIIFDLVYSVLGRNLAFALFGGVGGLSLIWGIIGWFKKRSGSAESQPEADHFDQTNP